jgi:hypothetical protein
MDSPQITASEMPSSISLHSLCAYPEPRAWNDPTFFAVYRAILRVATSSLIQVSFSDWLPKLVLRPVDPARLDQSKI